MNEADNYSNLMYFNDSSTIDISLDTQQVNENLVVESQQELEMGNIVPDNLLNNSSLAYDFVTNPTLSIEIIQETGEENIFFPNQSSSELLQIDKMGLLDKFFFFIFNKSNYLQTISRNRVPSIQST